MLLFNLTPIVEVPPTVSLVLLTASDECSILLNSLHLCLGKKMVIDSKKQW